jgi:phosphoglycerate kinase
MMFAQKKLPLLEDLELEGKTVFFRVDMNAPVDKEGQVTDDTRIRSVLPTLDHLLQHGARVVMASHRGRPKGKVVEADSLLPVAQHLAELIDTEITFADDCVGDGVKKLLQDAKRQLIVLENLRFHKDEEQGSEVFARALMTNMDAYVTDAFGTFHRDHASITQAPRFAKQKAVGRLVQNELSHLMPLTQQPAKPYAVVLGGAKISDKIKLLEQLVKRVDRLMIGGAMAFTFLKAQGIRIGDSLYEEEMIPYAKKIIQQADARNVSLFFPRDFVTVSSLDAMDVETTPTRVIENGRMGLDVGPLTIEMFGTLLNGVKTIFWNGPLGMFETKPFDKATMVLAERIAQLPNAVKIVGGGDSVAAVNASGHAADMDHISTGGGATLQFLHDPMLPGLKAIAK